MIHTFLLIVHILRDKSLEENRRSHLDALAIVHRVLLDRHLFVSLSLYLDTEGRLSAYFLGLET